MSESYQLNAHHDARHRVNVFGAVVSTADYIVSLIGLYRSSHSNTDLVGRDQYSYICIPLDIRHIRIDRVTIAISTRCHAQHHNTPQSYIAKINVFRYV